MSQHENHQNPCDASVLARITQQRRDHMLSISETDHYRQSRLAAYIADHPRCRRSLAAALRQPHKGFILECKKASPSKGLIRDPFDPVAIASIYQRYAAAISVLTEPDHFAGDFAYLQAVRNSVQVPVICKDFITTPLHVYLARYHGADAILLMLSVLDDAAYQALAALALKLDMEVLTEVNSRDEMRRAAALNAPIIGINHRNLHDLSIDLNRTAELAPLAPPDALLIAESGISTNQQVRELGQHVDGFLVGSHLTAQADIDSACRKLIFGTHKVCGLSQVSCALHAAAAGATYGGLIFAPHSPRCVSLEQAQRLTQQAPVLAYVAVVTSNDFDDISALAAALPIVALQLHGGQDPELIKPLRGELAPEVEIWYALDMTSLASDLATQVSSLLAAGVSKVVLDQGKGGSGKPFDWTQLDALHPAQRQHCMLAGGLNIDNVQDAAALNVAGLDFNSGLEASPGIKDPVLVHEVFAQLASYYRDAPQEATTREEIAP